MSVFAKASASRSRSLKSILSGIAIVGAGALVLSACSTPGTDAPEQPGDREELTLHIGTLLPQTGALAFLGPPEEAGVALAVKEINEANAGITVEVTYGDSGDPDNKAYATTVPNLLAEGVDAIIGAAASGVSKLVIDQVVSAHAPGAQVPLIPTTCRVLSLEDRTDPVALLGTLVNQGVSNRLTVVFDGGAGDEESPIVAAGRAADEASHPELVAEVTRIRELGFLST